MHFSIKKYSLLILLGLVSSFSIQAKNIRVHPIGIIIRPSLLDRLVTAFNKQSKPTIFSEGCYLDFGYEISGSVKFSSPRWIQDSETHLDLSIIPKDLELDVELFETCDTKNESAHLASFSGRLSREFVVRADIDPRDLSIRFSDDSIKGLANNLVLESDKFKAIAEEWNNNEIFKIEAFRFLSGYAQSALGEWFSDRLRLTHVESIGSLLSRSEVWNDGVAVQDGAISLKNSGPAAKNKELAIAFYPRSHDSLEIRQNSIAFYLNSTFISGQALEQVRTGDGRALAFTGDWMADVNRFLQSTEFEKPDAKPLQLRVTENGADFSLFFDDSLVNEALISTYQEDLLRFNAESRLGVQTKGIISDSAPDVSIRAELDSLKAPKIEFRSNTLSLNVSDYFVRLGTFVEDRLIPSTSVGAILNMSAGLSADTSSGTVNLSIDPSSFQIALSNGGDLPNKFTDPDLRLIESIINQLGGRFFEQYPAMVLFPTIFETDRANIEIMAVEVQDKIIMMHFRLDEGSVKL